MRIHHELKRERVKSLRLKRLRHHPDYTLGSLRKGDVTHEVCCLNWLWGRSYLRYLGWENLRDCSPWFIEMMSGPDPRLEYASTPAFLTVEV